LHRAERALLFQLCLLAGFVEVCNELAQLFQLSGLEWACIARAARPAGAVVTVAVTAAPLLFGCTSLHETFVSEKLSELTRKQPPFSLQNIFVFFL
jgi:hypothetical protein